MNKKMLAIFGSIIAIACIIIIILVVNNNKKYEVSFNTNGGTLIASQTVKKGEKVEKPNDPIKKDCIFVEWVLDGKTYDFSNEVSSNINLVAKWVKKEGNKQYVVKFNSDGGTTIKNQIIEENEKAIKPNDPVKDEYTFEGWFYNEELYDFNTIIDKDVELTAKWKKIENVTTKKKITTTTKKANTQTTTKKEIKLSTPTITESGKGASEDGITVLFEIKNIDGVTGVEVYSSTSKNGTYVLQNTVKKESLINNNSVEVNVVKGQHLYYKVRTYVKNSAGTFYSEYSNIMDVKNLLITPTITESGKGASENGITVLFEIKNIDGVTGVEVYSSTSENGTYVLQNTVKKESLIDNNSVEVNVVKGQHLYYKVRTYVKNSAGTFYSEYSNIMDVNANIN